jgi:hypothetical protein
MKKEILVYIIDSDTEVQFYFEYSDSEDIIFETKLTPEQLLQVFQHSGIDFYADIEDDEKNA